MRRTLLPIGIVVVLAALTHLPTSQAFVPLTANYLTASYLPAVFKPAGSPTRVPTSTPLPSLTVTPSPVPLRKEIKVQAATGQYDGTYFDIYGDAINTGNLDVYRIKVIARLLDASGSLIATDYTYTMLEHLAPGVRSPFRILLSNAPTGIVKYELEAQIGEKILDFRTLAVASVRVRDNDGPEVFGEVRNDQAEKINNGRVAVTFYLNDQVVYADYTYLGTDLPPTAKTIYKLTTYERNIVYDRVLVQAEGYTD